MAAVESTIINFVQWLRLAVEATGALVIAVGVIMRFTGSYARLWCNTLRVTSRFG